MQNVMRVGGAGLVAALLTAGCGGTPQSFGATPTGGAGTPAAATSGAVPAPPVTAQEAQETALDALGGGWILETAIEERDDDDDRDGPDRDGPDWDGDDDFEADVDVWEVTVVGPDGVRRTVSVDLTGGKVLHTEIDD